MVGAVLEGKATPSGTQAFRERLPEIDPTHWSDLAGLSLGSIGIGTYLGEESPEKDWGYQGAILAAVPAGVNVIDTAINYRYQRSERVIGQTLPLLEKKGITRDQLFIATKGGFLSYDADTQQAPKEWLQEHFFDPGIITPRDIVADMHCMAPAYLRHEIAMSKQNLGIACIDLYYLHNPELQRGQAGELMFLGRLKEAIEVLEEEVAAGHIARYGLATWEGFRVPRDHQQFLDLDVIMNMAEDVAGPDHHLAAIQLPLNLFFVQALLQRHQKDATGQPATILAAAQRHGLAVFASASLLQGKLITASNEQIDRLFSNLPKKIHRAMQFARSAPGVTTALVGMSSREHVAENLALLTRPRMDPARLTELFME